MTHTVSILTDVPELDLHRGDVILLDTEERSPVALWRAMPLNLAITVAILLSQGLASSNLTSDEVALVAQGVDPLAPADGLVPRSGRDRQLTHLRLEA